MDAAITIRWVQRKFAANGSSTSVSAAGFSAGIDRSPP